MGSCPLFLRTMEKRRSHPLWATSTRPLHGRSKGTEVNYIIVLVLAIYLLPLPSPFPLPFYPLASGFKQDPSLPPGMAKCEFCGKIDDYESYLTPSRRYNEMQKRLCKCRLCISCFEKNRLFIKESTKIQTKTL